ncbi:MAG: DMT family transporter [Opitutae bacterium]|nr:DMT family transporter [Opitutae bacterium]
MKTALFSVLALVAFAANSVLCRLALGRHLIDAASFTSVRLLAGAAMLLLLRRVLAVSSASDSSSWRRRGALAAFRPALRAEGGAAPVPEERAPYAGNWPAAAMLFAYAAAFSFAYVTLPTATGALLLFGAVQLTMLLHTLVKGHRLHALEWTGLVLAFTGFLYLVLPGITAPSFAGFALMTIAGAAWGFYTLLGRSSQNPLADTAGNFLRTLPMLGLLFPFAWLGGHASAAGILWAVLSGAVTSGLGYTVWYFALRNLTATRAAAMQLAVPVLAAFGGVAFLGESITLRMTLAAALVLGGIALVIRARTGAVRRI